MNREEWLSKSAVMLAQILAGEGAPKTAVRASVGFPSTRALSTSKRRVGECWHSAASADRVPVVFVSPVLHDSIEVLGVLLHEMIHAACGKDVGHRGEFKRLADAVGLIGPATQTRVGDELAVALGQIVDELGDYPQPKFDPLMGDRKKQSTRLLKILCSSPTCGYTARTTQKWLDIGLPTCVCGAPFKRAGEDL